MTEMQKKNSGLASHGAHVKMTFKTALVVSNLEYRVREKHPWELHFIFCHILCCSSFDYSCPISARLFGVFRLMAKLRSAFKHVAQQLLHGRVADGPREEHVGDSVRRDVAQ